MNLVTILSEAKLELLDAIEYYDSKSLGLGLDFAREVKASIEEIKHFPKRWTERDDNTRRYLTHRFPYIVIYLYYDNHIWIVAISHCKRRPNYWKDRLKSITEQGSS